MSATTKRTASLYRLTHTADAWISAEAERLGVSKNAVVEMTIRAAMDQRKREDEADERARQRK